MLTFSGRDWLILRKIECVRSYIRDNFVSEGMIADWALHDKGDGNPHAHILLTLRGLDEHEKWLQKQKTVFANSRDEKGRPVYDPSLPSYDPKNKEKTSKYRIPQLDKDGKQKVRIREGKGTEYLWEKISIPANDWNEHTKAEQWRASWAEHCNRYLKPEQMIDHRSYERQGIEKEPTIHEGVVARQSRETYLHAQLFLGKVVQKPVLLDFVTQFHILEHLVCMQTVPSL